MKNWKNICAAVLAGAFLAPCAGAQERGAGPFTLRTAQNSFTVRLLKKSPETLWVLKQTESGGYFEAGIAVREVVAIEMPRPRVFDVADQAVTPEQIAQAQAALKAIADMLKPFRDLPGVIADEALLRQGRLLERRQKWAEALAMYEDILVQPYTSRQSVEARMRAGLCAERSGNPAKAVQYLEGVAVSDEDPDLLSDVMLAKGKALQALDRPRDAVMSYLYLVVFYPYVRTNEARCLAAALPSYAAMKDWDGLFKTVQTLQDTYPKSAEAGLAREYLDEYKEQLEKERLYASPKTDNAAIENKPLLQKPEEAQKKP